MIRVLLAEDQAMVRGALAALLALESDIDVVGAAPDGVAAWREVERLKPDVLVTDIEMPGLTGLELAQRSGRAIDPQLAVDAWSEADPLNDRERQVLRLAGEGLTAGDIAAQLHLSAGTVRNYLSEAIGKLGAANRVEAYRTARQKGWL